MQHTYYEGIQAADCLAEFGHSLHLEVCFFCTCVGAILSVEEENCSSMEYE